MKNIPTTIRIEEVNYIRKGTVIKSALLIAAILSPVVGYVVADVLRALAFGL